MKEFKFWVCELSLKLVFSLDPNPLSMNQALAPSYFKLVFFTAKATPTDHGIVFIDKFRRIYAVTSNLGIQVSYIESYVLLYFNTKPTHH